MRTLLAIPALLLLVSCAKPAITPPRIDTDGASSSSEAAEPVESASGDLAVTIEPFEDPLAPISLTGALVDIEERALSGGILEIGSARAPLTVTIFVHPESEYAREFQRSRMPALISEFVARGRVKIQAFILPIEKYTGSAFAARAVSCAAKQGEGYPALDMLVTEGRVDLTEADIAELGIDATLYRSCVQTGTDDPSAGAARAATVWNVTLVPSYVIDGETIVGLPTEADFLGAVRSAL